MGNHPVRKNGLKLMAMKAIYTYHKQSFVCIDTTNEHSHVSRSTRLDSWNNPYATLIIKILITLMEKISLYYIHCYYIQILR